MAFILLLTSCNITIFCVFIGLPGWAAAGFEPDLTKGIFEKTSWVLMVGTVCERSNHKQQLT